MKKRIEIKIKETQNKGITLIALVITIIVLLILAGITIAMLTGDNGILTKAETAQRETKRQEIIECAKIEIAEVQVENEGNITDEEALKIIAKYDKTYNPENTEFKFNKNEEGEDYLITQNDDTILVSEIWKVKPKIHFTIQGIPFTANSGETWMEWIKQPKNLERCLSLRKDQNDFDILLLSAIYDKNHNFDALEKEYSINCRTGGENVGFGCNGKVVYWGYKIMEADYYADLLDGSNMWEDYNPSLAG